MKSCSCFRPILAVLCVVLFAAAPAVAGETYSVPLPAATDDAALKVHLPGDDPTSAEARSPQDPQGQRRNDRRPTDSLYSPELRDETFRLMDAYVISNLQESLGLTDEQFAKALPLVKKLHSDRRMLAKRRLQALRVLRKSLASGSATEAGIADLLKDAKAASAEERAGAVRNIEALDAVLTPLQQAKYRVFEAEVDLRLRHLLARSQSKDRPEGR